MVEPRIYDLRDFIREEVATPDEWQEWEQVRNAAPPDSTPMLHAEPFYHRFEEPSREYQRRLELEAEFVSRAREKLITEQWQVSVRYGVPPTRRTLEPIDIERAIIDFERGLFGSGTDVAIRRPAGQPRTEVLGQFIRNVCDVASPAEPMTKTLVQELARRLCPESYSDNAFRAAWDDAPLDERWKRAGRRR